MKFLIIASLALVSVSSFASTASLIESCREVGVAKVMGQAEAMKLDVDADSIVECGVDNRALNPYKYVWFCGTASTGEKISQMTQKAPFKKCI